VFWLLLTPVRRPLNQHEAAAYCNNTEMCFLESCQFCLLHLSLLLQFKHLPCAHLHCFLHMFCPRLWDLYPTQGARHERCLPSLSNLSIDQARQPAPSQAARPFLQQSKSVCNAGRVGAHWQQGFGGEGAPWRSAGLRLSLLLTAA
jgi:hypothetical protein